MSTMSDKVRAEYERVLARVVIRHGSVVVREDGWYGWSDYNASQHLRSCGVASHGTPHEDTWQEFKGTFYEGDTSIHGVGMPGVTCNCGTISDRSMRVLITVQEIAEAVFSEAYQEWHSDSEDAPVL